MRAVAESNTIAALLGIPVERTVASTLVISGVLAGAAGALTSLVYHTITPFIGLNLLLKGMTGMVLGGLGNVYGAMLGGLLVGLIETLVVNYGSSTYSGPRRVRRADPDLDVPPRRPARRANPRAGLSPMFGIYYDSVLTGAGINVLLALGLYFTIATGQFSVGHGGFMAIGAYSASILTTNFDMPLVPAVLLGGIAAFAAGCWSGCRCCASRGSISPWRRSASARSCAACSPTSTMSAASAACAA